MKLLEPERLLGVAFALGMYCKSDLAIGLQRFSGMTLPGNGCRVHELRFAVQLVVAGS